MAQTSPEDLEEKGLDNNQEAKPEKSLKSVEGHGRWGGGRDISTRAWRKEHTERIKGKKSAEALMGRRCEDSGDDIVSRKQ